MSVALPASLEHSSLRIPVETYIRLENAVGPLLISTKTAVVNTVLWPRLRKDLLDRDSAAFAAGYKDHRYVFMKDRRDNKVQSCHVWDITTNSIPGDGRTRAQLEEKYILEISETPLIEEQQDHADDLLAVLDSLPDLGDIPWIKKMLIQVGLALVKADVKLNQAAMDGFKAKMKKVFSALYILTACAGTAADIYNWVNLPDKSYLALTAPYVIQALILARQQFGNEDPQSWRLFRTAWDNYLVKAGTQAETIKSIYDEGYRGTRPYFLRCLFSRVTMSFASIFGSAIVRKAQSWTMRQLAALRMDSFAMSRWLDDLDEAAERMGAGLTKRNLLKKNYILGRPTSKNYNPDQSRGVEVVTVLRIIGLEEPAQITNEDLAEKAELVVLTGGMGALAISTARTPFSRINASILTVEMCSTAVFDTLRPGIDADFTEERVNARVTYILCIQLTTNALIYVYGPEVLNDFKSMAILIACQEVGLWSYAEAGIPPITKGLVLVLDGGIALTKLGWRMTKAVTSATYKFLRSLRVPVKAKDVEMMMSALPPTEDQATATGVAARMEGGDNELRMRLTEVIAAAVSEVEAEADEADGEVAHEDGEYVWVPSDDPEDDWFRSGIQLDTVFEMLTISH